MDDKENKAKRDLTKGNLRFKGSTGTGKTEIMKELVEKMIPLTIVTNMNDCSLTSDSGLRDFVDTPNLNINDERWSGFLERPAEPSSSEGGGVRKSLRKKSNFKP